MVKIDQYTKKTKWLVSIRNYNQRRDIVITTVGEETPQETYRRAKAKAEKAREQVGNRATVDLISLTVAFKPKGAKPYRSWYWCPYCNKWRVFLWNEYIGYNQCSICGISDNDFYVKTYNNLWNKAMIGRKVKL